MKLQILQEKFTICKISDVSQVNFNDEFVFFGKTDEEFSLVCKTDSAPENTLVCDPGWRAFRIQGQLDFSLIGILSKITKVLADCKIGIFAVSTYNTDYVLMKQENLARAMQALAEAGYDCVS